MKYYLKLSLTLFMITFIATGILAYVNSKTSPIIAENSRKAENEARKIVLPQGENFIKQTYQDFDYYIAKDKEKQTLGYCFVAKGDGYSSLIQTMVGVDKNFEVKNIKILFQSETPGLGANAENDDFQAQFIGKKASQIAPDKDGGEIVSLTGATITTRAISNSITNSIKKLKSAIDSQKE